MSMKRERERSVAWVGRVEVSTLMPVLLLLLFSSTDDHPLSPATATPLSLARRVGREGNGFRATCSAATQPRSYWQPLLLLHRPRMHFSGCLARVGVYVSSEDGGGAHRLGGLLTSR